MESWRQEMYTSELYHHGIIGQKWGVRRYQNKDGTWTQAGKERYGNKETAKSNKNGPRKKWTNEQMEAFRNSSRKYEMYNDIEKVTRRFNESKSAKNLNDVMTRRFFETLKKYNERPDSNQEDDAEFYKYLHEDPEYSKAVEKYNDQFAKRVVDKLCQKYTLDEISYYASYGATNEYSYDRISSALKAN